MRQKLQKLEKVLLKKIERSEKVAEYTKESANIISIGAASSPSASGDREHAVNQAKITGEALDALKILLQEIHDAVHEPLPDRVVVPSFVKVIFTGGESSDLYIVQNPVFVADVKIISINSPLGKIILGKKSGENFEYELDDKTRVKGKISEIN